MTRRATCCLLAVSLLLGSCAKKSGDPADKEKKASAGKGGGASPEAAVRGLIKAAKARDAEAALTFMVNDDVCALAEKMNKPKAACLEYVAEVRKQLPDFLESIPKGLRIRKIQIGTPPRAPEGSKMVAVYPEGSAKVLPFMTMKLEGRHYVGLGIRKKAGKKTQPVDKKAPEASGEPR